MQQPGADDDIGGLSGDPGEPHIVLIEAHGCHRGDGADCVQTERIRLKGARRGCQRHKKTLNEQRQRDEHPELCQLGLATDLLIRRRPPLTRTRRWTHVPPEIPVAPSLTGGSFAGSVANLKIRRRAS